MLRGTHLQPGLTTLVWWVGIVVATGLVAIGTATVTGPRPTAVTPFDATGSGHAKQWAFLDSVSKVVPDGSTLTIRAADSETEMSLYMMAVGLLPRAAVIPGSYYGRPVAESDAARFVAVYGARIDEPETASDTLVVTGGVVIDRGAPSP